MERRAGNKVGTWRSLSGETDRSGRSVRAQWARGVTNKAKRGQAMPGVQEDQDPCLATPGRAGPNPSKSGNPIRPARSLVGWLVGRLVGHGSCRSKASSSSYYKPLDVAVRRRSSLSFFSKLTDNHLRFIDLPVILFGLPFVIFSFLSVCRLSVTYSRPPSRAGA
ncbi:unnamed protein product [Calypogeia fissa]